MPLSHVIEGVPQRLRGMKTRFGFVASKIIRLFGIGKSLTAPATPTPPYKRISYTAVRQIKSMCTAYRPCTTTGASFPAVPRLHPSHRAYAPWIRRMQCRRSLASDLSSLSIPSRGTIRVFAVQCCSSCQPGLRLSTLQCLNSVTYLSAKTWLPDFHRHSYVPCPAHTFEVQPWSVPMS